MAQAAKQLWTMAELKRARELAFDVGLPASSVAKMLTHEFGTTRSRHAVASALRSHFQWRGKSRGTPTRGRQAA